MVSLARKEGESVVIGKDVEVRILRCANGQVKLGITAPEQSICRGEIMERFERANIQVAPSFASATFNSP